MRIQERRSGSAAPIPWIEAGILQEAPIMRILFPSVLLAIVGISHPVSAHDADGATLACPAYAEPQAGGDQFLDGIGETALVSRYLLTGSPRDWSRNTFHAVLCGTGATFPEDAAFGKVLALPGSGGACLALPSGMLQGVDAFSFSAWVFLEGEEDGPILDLGSTAGEGLRLTGDGVQVTLAGQTAGTSAPLARGRWVHVVVVLDPAARRLTRYVDGVVAGTPAEAPWDLSKLLPPKSTLAMRSAWEACGSRGAPPCVDGSGTCASTGWL